MPIVAFFERACAFGVRPLEDRPQPLVADEVEAAPRRRLDRRRKHPARLRQRLRRPIEHLDDARHDVGDVRLDQRPPSSARTSSAALYARDSQCALLPPDS